MQLALDIGNTNIKLGVFENNTLIDFFAQRDEMETVLEKYKIKQVILSRTGNDEWIEHLLKQKKRKVLVLSHELKLPIKLLYKTPETLGADRIAGSVAANHHHPDTPVLKIDFGTCITYDFITPQNEFEGGAISPGMNMRFKALHNYTAKLPLINPLQYTTYPLTGTDTATSILSGVVQGIKNEVQGIINQYRQRFSGMKVVVTGGDAGLFATLLESEIFARPHLVLEGLNIILQHNTTK
ncbi:MAG: type III pantothenate kinase [Chitinophagales bacterium]|nr:type III pantothenate kinase [Chitinophagales bacterium]